MAQHKEIVGIAVRMAAADRLTSVIKGAHFVPFSVSDLPEDRDRALANRLVTTALRRTGHLNHIVDDVLDRGLPKRSGSFEAVLRLALTELLFLPGQADHSAVFLAVEALKRDGRTAHLVRLMNGVLRRVQREAERYKSLDPIEVLPEWLADRWIAHFGAEAVAGFGPALLDGAPLDLTLKEMDAALIAALGGQIVSADTVRIATRDKSVTALDGYADGRWWVQDTASAWPARLMALPAGATVLDMCAAPGGKTAQLVKAGYKVTALDTDEARLERVKENLHRLGYNADSVVGDGRDLAGHAPYDGVLVDAPCTATGTFRRHPEVLWQRDPADLTMRSTLQQELLTSAANGLKPGGVLIYSTCSLEREEGEAQADWLVNALPFMENFPIAGKDVPGFETALDKEGRLRLHPGRAVPGDAGGVTDGFFVARFRRGRVQI